MTQRHDRDDDSALEDLLAEFSDTRTYRPTDDAAEPGAVPQAPSGTATAQTTASGTGAGQDPGDGEPDTR
ncbi:MULTISPECIES: hypothetical protein [Streptomyces]|uniref:Uncharacterized protein n=1 Tax=Streptomyces luteosporeus TaxID=173856 RepID=A0ABN3TS20_9ACTN